MRRSLIILAAVALLTSACASVNPPADLEPPRPIVASEIDTLLAESSGPVVLNVWASWCIPCRSEAPLLKAASSQFSDDVRFVMLNVRDTAAGAAKFIGEFFPDAPMEHYSDQQGGTPAHLGGNRGVPLTFFFAARGELVKVHFGVIDERTLALQIDEIQAR